MERPLRPLAFAFACLTALLVVLGGAIMLPHDRYYRFQELSSGSTRKADWIYERLNFDPTPVDVALIGTSRTAGGLSAKSIEEGYCKTTGRKIHVANLGVPETGRNMQYVVAKEATFAKQPSVLVVELNEVEPRTPHPGFIVLADARDVLEAPAWLNTNYLLDLARLPGRQAQLFYETLTKRPAVRARFNPKIYAGPYLDRTQEIVAIDGRILDKRVVKSAQDLDAMRAERMAHEAPFHALPQFLQPLEYRFSRLQLRKIERLARENGGDVYYAYLPAWRAPELPDDLKEELNVRPEIDLGGPSTLDHRFWFDATHVNAFGADDASRRFAEQLAARRRMLGRPGC